MDEKRLEAWAREERRRQEQMGELEDTAPIGFTVGIALVMLLRLTLFVGGCVLVVAIGLAVLRGMGCG